jgi:hypothetical protein
MTVRINDYFLGTGQVQGTSYPQGSFTSLSANGWELNDPTPNVTFYRSSNGLIAPSGSASGFLNGPDTWSGIVDSYQEAGITFGDVADLTEVIEAVVVGRGKFVFEYRCPAYGSTVLHAVVTLHSSLREVWIKGTFSDITDLTGSISAPGDTTEHLIRCEFSNLLVKVFIDGVEVASTTEPNTTPYSGCYGRRLFWQMEEASYTVPLIQDYLVVKRMTIMQAGDTPYPPPTNLIFHDTFAGASSDLNGSLSDTGQAWTASSVFGSPNIVRNGSLETEGIYSALIGDVNGISTTSGPLRLEAVIEIGAEYNTNTGDLYFYATDANALIGPNNGFGFRFTTSDPTGQSTLSMYLYKGGVTYSENYYISPVVPGIYTIIVNCSDDRDDFYAKVNGVTVLTANATTELGGPLTGEWFYSILPILRKVSGVYNEKINEISVYIPDPEYYGSASGTSTASASGVPYSSSPGAFTLDEIRVTVGRPRDVKLYQVAPWPNPGDIGNEDADNGWVDITGTKSGFPSQTKRFSISKAKSGSGGTSVTGQRGNVTLSRLISGNVWSNTEAALAISEAGYGSPINLDMVTLYNGAGYSETRFYANGSWLVVDQFINGNLLIRGTVGADALIAHSITADQLQVGLLEVADASIGTLKLAGNAVTVPQFYTGGDQLTINGTQRQLITASFDAQGGGFIASLLFYASPVNVDAYGEVQIFINNSLYVTQRFGIRSSGGGDVYYSMPIAVPFAGSSMNIVNITAYVKAVPHPGGATNPIHAKSISLSIMSGKR